MEELAAVESEIYYKVILKMLLRFSIDPIVLQEKREG